MEEEMSRVLIDINKRDGAGRTELHHAAKNNDLSKVKQLLSQGADVNLKDRFNFTPLHYLGVQNVDESHYEVAETLLKNGADPNAGLNEDETPFYFIVRRGNLKIVQLFLNFKADYNTVFSYGENLLFAAAECQNNVEVVKLLVELGLDVKHRETGGGTALHKAAWFNKNENMIKIVEILLKNGADVNVKNAGGRTPLSLSVQQGNLEAIELFRSYNADFSVVDNDGLNLLFLALTWSRKVKVIQLLLDAGLDVNSRDPSGKTPLHEAAINNIIESRFQNTELLLKNGSDPNARDQQGRTPLFNLAMSDDVDVIKMFLKYKADVSVVDNEGQNLLFTAAGYNENVQVIKLLIDLGLDVNHRCNSGSTPLHKACENITACQNIEVIKYLLKNGANPNAVDIDGYTPVIRATQRLINSRGNGEYMIQNLNFIIKYADFRIIHNNVNILSLNFESYHAFIWKKILKHLAKVQLLQNSPVSPVLLQIIFNKNTYNNYFNLHREELLQAKNIKLKNSWVTFFDLLVDDRKKLKNYAGNKDLIDDFIKNDCVKKFPNYGALMEHKMKKAIRRRELYDESANLLSDCLPILNPTHLIIRDVLDCILSKKDLLKLCKLN